MEMEDQFYSGHELSVPDEDEDVLLWDHSKILVTEELSKILSFLGVEEKQKIRAVCRKWRDTIDVEFGIKIRVKNSTSDLILCCPHAFEVELHSMTQPFDSGISFAKTVRKLVFSNIVVTYNLVSFLRACSNITHLGFANIILDLPINDPWSQLVKDEEKVQLPQLDTLEIKCFTFIEGVVEILNFLNEKVLLYKLRDVSVWVQNQPIIPYQMMFQNGTPGAAHPLIRLLMMNRPTLQKFVIGRPNLPTIFKFYPSTAEGSGGGGGIFPPQIEHLEIHPYFREEWEPMLRDQTGIKVMNFGSCNVSRWPEIQESIVMNSASLQSFTIGGLSFGQIWDCSVFRTCFKLSELSIEISHSNKINLGMLPIQLKKLGLFGPVPKHEILAVAESLISLENLKFTHLGRIAEFNNAEEDKVTLAIFKSLLQLPNLKILTFATCSTISIDWDIISLWCANVDGFPGFGYSEKYFQTHGEYFRNGITVELSDSFKRDEFDWSTVPHLSSLELDSESPSSLSITPESESESGI